MKKLRITIEGKTYDVDVEILGEEQGHGGSSTTVSAAPARAAAIAAPTAPAPAKPAVAAADGAVVSPLAATIISIDVQVGQEVAAGDKLLTLEAMKMNTIVNAPQAGKVSKIHIQATQSVEEGQPLISLS